MKKNSTLKLVQKSLFLMGLFWGISGAVTYDTQKNFLQRNIPAGSILSKSTFNLTPEERSALATKWKWRGEVQSMEMIVAKNATGAPQGSVYMTTLYATEHKCVHKIGVALKADGTVSEVILFELFCERAMPAASKSFLGQFKDKKMAPLEINKDINGVTKATESSKTIIEAVNIAMAGYSSFVLNKK